ncbi:MAG: hypothetical protein OXU23_11295 [Candidatus Poribacteria bacterium]|nr:hypothetical protein [Candidatus Poribacteria bacterium]
MSTSKYPNRDTLQKALDIYLDAVRPFVVRCLNQISEETAEDIIEKTCGNDTIECKDIPYLFRTYWDPFDKHFYSVDQYYEARSAVQIIVEGRNRASHPPWDIDSEFTRTQLFIIAELLGKINRSDKQQEVEKIRDDLFYDDTKERLAEAEKRIMEIEAEKIEYPKNEATLTEKLSETEERLKEAESEKHEYEKSKKELSQQLLDNALKIEDTSKQLNEAKAEIAKYKKNLAEKNKCLEVSEAAQSDYKERLKTESEKLKDTKAELLVSKENLADASSQLTSMQAEKKAAERGLTAASNLLRTVTVDDQISKRIHPYVGNDSAVRIFDHRDIKKQRYLSNLLDLEQPSIIYVLNEVKLICY